MDNESLAKLLLARKILQQNEPIGPVFVVECYPGQLRELLLPASNADQQ